MGIIAGTRSNSLTGQAAGFLQRLGQTFRDVLVWKPSKDGSWMVMGHLTCFGKMVNKCKRQLEKNNINKKQRS